MAAPVPTALVLDWGGVLTASLDGAMTRWAGAEGVDYGAFRDVMRQWVGRRTATGSPEDQDLPDAPVQVLEEAPDSGPAGQSPVHRLERGELSVSAFESELSRELARRGSPVVAQGLVDRMLGSLDRLEDDMVGLVRRARAVGLRTALLSNSWGDDHYPDSLWDNLFDVVVISGRVGMRKPERRIFEHTAELLGVPTGACVMVDDMVHNVRAAVDAGMVAVHHTSYDLTALELEAIFDLPLR